MPAHHVRRIRVGRRSGESAGKLDRDNPRTGTTIEWDVVVEMERPIKTITTIVRGVPRGQVSLGGGGFSDQRDNELLGGYTFGAGDFTAGPRQA